MYPGTRSGRAILPAASGDGDRNAGRQHKVTTQLGGAVILLMLLNSFRARLIPRCVELLNRRIQT
jgi:hypothetical protein